MSLPSRPREIFDRTTPLIVIKKSIVYRDMIALCGPTKHRTVPHRTTQEVLGGLITPSKGVHDLGFSGIFQGKATGFWNLGVIYPLRFVCVCVGVCHCVWEWECFCSDVCRQHFPRQVYFLKMETFRHFCKFFTFFENVSKNVLKRSEKKRKIFKTCLISLPRENLGACGVLCGPVQCLVGPALWLQSDKLSHIGASCYDRVSAIKTFWNWFNIF